MEPHKYSQLQFPAAISLTNPAHRRKNLSSTWAADRILDKQELPPKATDTESPLNSHLSQHIAQTQTHLPELLLIAFLENFRVNSLVTIHKNL